MRMLLTCRCEGGHLPHGVQVLPLASLLAERGWARAALLLASDGVWCAPPSMGPS